MTLGLQTAASGLALELLSPMSAPPVIRPRPAASQLGNLPATARVLTKPAVKSSVKQDAREKRSAGPGSAMPPLRAISIPAIQAVSNSPGFSANLFYLFKLSTERDWVPGFEKGATTAALSLPEITKTVCAPSTGNRKYPPGNRLAALPFGVAGFPKSTLEKPAEQSADKVQVVLPPAESPLLWIDNSIKKRSPAGSHLDAESELQDCNSHSTPARQWPESLRPHGRFLRVQESTCSQKTMAQPPFSLDNALPQQTSLAVWFFARANRFTNDYR